MNEPKLFDIVELTRSAQAVRASIRDCKDMKDGSRLYKLRMGQGHYLTARDNDFTLTGDSEAPFLYNEVVQVNSGDSECQQINGSIGKIVGISVSEEERWYFAVMFEGQQCWFLSEGDLTRIDPLLPEEGDVLFR